MLFSVGSKVKFLHTPDEGVIRALLDNGMVSVYIPASDLEIPAFIDDLIRAEDFTAPPVKAKDVPVKQKPEPPQPPLLEIETQYHILKSMGIQLALEPLADASGMVAKYRIYLINDTQYHVVLTLRLLLNHRSPHVWDGQISPVSYQQAGEMLYDDLNEAPEFEVECKWVTTEGVEPPVSKSLKIKPKTFFSSQRTAPLLNRSVHLYRLFEKPVDSILQKGEDLQEYTKRHAKPSWKNVSHHAHLSVHDTKALAEFEPEIDLHIEKLTDNWAKMNNSEILRLQMSHFERFINKAIRLGVSRVFVIHGVGEGKLRDAIATSLVKNPDVQTFKNEYHHRYGWGATEIIF